MFLLSFLIRIITNFAIIKCVSLPVAFHQRIIVCYCESLSNSFLLLHVIRKFATFIDSFHIHYILYTLQLHYRFSRMLSGKSILMVLSISSAVDSFVKLLYILGFWIQYHCS